MKTIRIIPPIAFLSITFILWGANDWVLLPSISEYYHHQLKWFVLLLTLASGWFIASGFFNDNRRENIITGFALLGVVVFNNHDWFYLHYVFAIVFFGVECLNMIRLVTQNKSLTLLSFAILILVSISLCALLPHFTIFWMEFVAMIPTSATEVMQQLGLVKKNETWKF